ncbi:MAG: 4Fe-4S binding protein [Armatimonadota bacterium]
MGSIIKKTKRLTRLRYLSQFIALVILGLPYFDLKTICCPALYCHSCPLSMFACPIGVLVNFSTFRIIPFVTLGILGLVGAFLGRLVCGWICPFGLLQDLLSKIPVKKFSIPRPLRYTKYLVLVGLVFIVPFFFPGAPYSFCNFCPSGTLESALPRRLFLHETSPMNLMFYVRVSILAAFFIFTILVTRGFCRMFCPLGAIFSLFNRISIFRMRLAMNKCTHCGACAKKCPVDIDPVDDINSAECIRCLDCTPIGHLKLGSK